MPHTLQATTGVPKPTPPGLTEGGSEDFSAFFQRLLSPAGFTRQDSRFFGDDFFRDDFPRFGGPPVAPPPGPDDRKPIGPVKWLGGGIDDLLRSMGSGSTGSAGAEGSAGAGDWSQVTLESIFPEGVLEGLQGLFQKLLTNPGIPANVMTRAQSFSRGELLGQERRRIQRRSDEFSGRGMFGSGPSARSIRGIEADTQTEIGRSATALSLEDARLAAAGRQLAASLGLGMGGMGLDVGRLNLAGELGFGDLDLRRLALEIQKAIEEARMNFDIRRWFLGGDESGPFNYGDAFGDNKGGGIGDWLDDFLGSSGNLGA